MTLYSFVLFAHITAVLAMFACLSLEVLSLFRLQRASTLSEVQLWIEAVPSFSRIALGSLLVILLTGVFLTIQMSGFGLAWLKVTIAAFFLNGTAGGSVRQTHPLRAAPERERHDESIRDPGSAATSFAQGLAR